MRGLALAGVALLAACGGTEEASCRIELTETARLKPEGEEGFAEVGLVPSRTDPHGNRYVMADASEPRLFRFAAGAVEGSPVLRLGAGPGEFSRPMAFMPYRGDSLILLDRGNARATIFTQDLKPGRQFILSPFGALYAILEDGAFIAAHGVSMPGPRTWPIPAEGFKDGAGGPDVSSLGAPGEVPPFVWIGSMPGGWWEMTLEGPFELTWRGLAGDERKRVSLAGGQFVDYTEYRQFTPTDPPLPTLSGGWLDAAGQFWVVGTVADANWAEGLGERKVMETGLEYYEVLDALRVWDGLIQARDTATWAVLAELQVDSALAPLGGPASELYRTVEDDDGWATLQIYEAKLVGACGG